MIKSLQIKGFQSHADNSLIFDKGVNVIVGESDSGKSAVLRALLWLIQNKPSGDDFRSNWADKTNVQIEVDNHTISRYRSKTVNSYTLDNLEFKAMGTEVPKEIQDVLNIEAININRQLDSPFLLSESPGNVATHFNKVAKLDKIDTGLQNINSWMRELTSAIKYDEGQEEDLKEGLSRFSHLEKFEIEVEVLEEMDKQYITSLQKQTKLENLLSNINDMQADIKEASKILIIEKPVNAILKDIDLLAEADLEEVRLDKLVNEIKELQIEIEEQKQILSIEKPLNNILKLYEELDKAELEQKSLFKLFYNINDTQDRYDRQSVSYMALKASFEKAMPVGSECPICGQIIKR